MHPQHGRSYIVLVIRSLDVVLCLKDIMLYIKLHRM